MAIAMTEDEFQNVMVTASLMARVAVGDADYAGALAALQYADAIGCYTDPTLWRSQLNDREEAQKLLGALIPFVAAAKAYCAAADGAKAARGG